MENTNKPVAGNQMEDILLDIQESSVAQASTEKVWTLKGIFDAVNDWMIDQTPIKLEEILLFFQLFGAVINAGINIDEALNLLSQQTKNPRFQKIILNMYSRVRDGESLASAMLNQGDIFDEATCSIIDAGEKSGRLKDILKELIAQYERMEMIQKKVKGAMTYPVVVLSVMALLVVVVMIFVVPKLTGLFGGSENLPLPTRMLIGASDFFIQKWWLILLAIVSVFVLFSAWKKSETGKKQIAQIILNIPGVNAFIKGLVLSRVTRMFGFLVSAGVPMIESLRISAHIAGNAVYKNKILMAADDLSRGIAISENFADDESLFPTFLVSMISIGEKSASLGSIMGKAADFYDEDLDSKVGTLSKLMEPIILMFMAVGAVFMIMAIYLPILQMNDKVIG